MDNLGFELQLNDIELLEQIEEDTENVTKKSDFINTFSI